MTPITPPARISIARPDIAGGGRARRIAGRGLAVALALSVLLHAAFTLWPVRMPTDAETVPLTATITELPPPPAVVAAAAPKPRPKAKRAPVASAAAPVAQLQTQ